MKSEKLIIYYAAISPSSLSEALFIHTSRTEIDKFVQIINTKYNMNAKIFSCELDIKYNE